MASNYIYNPHVSVDCVVFGFDGINLKVLLIERHIEEQNEFYNDKKLPGSLIIKDEGLDEAATRVLTELTGLKNIYLSQFKSFGGPERTKDPRDILWLENMMKLKIDRIVTVGYVAFIKINRKILVQSNNTEANWYDLDEVLKMQLAFDHSEIIKEALKHIKHRLNLEPHLFFELLPRKFTISQLRTLHDKVHQVRSDVRNFQKQVAQKPYIVALDELEKDVPHRAARLYMFDRKKTV